MKLCFHSRIRLFIAFLALHSVVGFFELNLGGVDVSNPILFLEKAGLFSFRNPLGDSYHLFFGKRKLLCGLKMLNVFLNTGETFSGGFRANSEMVLPEAGFYVGDENIQEYIDFTNRISPYVRRGPRIRVQEPVVIGYNDDGVCEYHWTAINTYTLDKDMTETNEEVHFAAPVLIKLFVDYQEGYIRRAHVYYSKNFLGFFFRVLNTRAVAESMCNVVLNSTGCTELIGPPPDDCVEQMLSLPLVTGDTYVDGDSFGCRILHASFARTNFKHCAHVSLDPFDLDPNGIPTCSQSFELPISRYITDEEVERFEQFSKDHGVEPAFGFKLVDGLKAPLV